MESLSSPSNDEEYLMNTLDEVRELLAISRTVLEVSDADEPLQLIVEKAAALAHADACLLLLDDGTAHGRVAASVGVEPERARSFLPRVDERLKEALCEFFNRDPSDTFAFIPIIDRGKLQGVLALYRRKRQAPSPYHDVLLSALTDQAAFALEHAAKSRRRERLLAKASAELGGSLESAATLQDLVRVLVPDLADWCVIDLRTGGAIEQVACAHVDPEKERLLRQLGRRLPMESDLEHGVGHVLATGKADIYPEVTDKQWVAHALGIEHPRILRELEARSYMCVPLCARNHPSGAISFVYAESNRRFGEEDLALAEELGRRTGVWLENARLYERANEAIRMRDDVLAVVSHDLKNPLNVVSMGVESALRKIATGRAAELEKTLLAIQRAGAHMAGLIEELLEVAHIQAGQLTLERRTEELSSVVRQALELLEPMAEQKSQHLNTTLPPEPVTVCWDSQRMIRVLGNLVGNAVKFTPEGGRISVHAERIGDEILFSIADSGIGIAPADLPRVFEPYWKGEASGRSGTGLGLYIARGIVRAHGGRIWVESQLGIGSTFWFAVPRGCGAHP
jgi:signal transduction histidine kinase